MKKNIYLIMILIEAIVPCATAVTITNVQISPVQPSISDIITIQSQGTFSGGTNWYDTSVFTVDELSLQLDLYFTSGFGPDIPQAWWHDDEIGTLSLGNYVLLVQMYCRSSGATDYILHDSYSTDFEVVPEPATIVLFCVGGILTRA